MIAGQYGPAVHCLEVVVRTGDRRITSQALAEELQKAIEHPNADITVSPVWSFDPEEGEKA